MLEIQSLPGDTNLASPGKPLFAIILIIKWLQIGGLPSDLHESPRGLKKGIRDKKTTNLIP